MKKQVLSVCAAVASVVAFASAVESSNTFGVIKIDAGETNASRDVFISVPWIGVGNAESAQTIDGKSLVLASQLNVGDLLLVYGGGSTTGKFGAWAVNSSHEWEAATVSDESATWETGDNDGLNRGSGVVVRTAQRYIYVYGQYSATESALTIANASGWAYTLIGTGFAKDYDLNNTDQVTWTGTIDKEDYIVTALGTQYTRNSANTAWQKPDGTTTDVQVSANLTVKKPNYTTVGVTLPQGRGGWYAHKGNAELSVTFKNYTPAE